MAETIKHHPQQSLKGLRNASLPAAAKPDSVRSKISTDGAKSEQQVKDVTKAIAVFPPIGFPWVLAEMMYGNGELGVEVQENYDYTYYARIGAELFSFYA